MTASINQAIVEYNSISKIFQNISVDLVTFWPSICQDQIPKKEHIIAITNYSYIARPITAVKCSITCIYEWCARFSQDNRKCLVAISRATNNTIEQVG